jgi:hypothetical protein
MSEEIQKWQFLNKNSNRNFLSRRGKKSQKAKHLPTKPRNKKRKGAENLKKSRK